jgi:RimJ/RimL family protein N-acetyltransferase
MIDFKDPKFRPLLIDIPMPIETPRLTLRPAMPGDGSALQEAKVETFDQLHQWMPWAKEMSALADDEITVREAYARFIRREDMMLFAFEKDTGRYIAGTGLHRFDWNIRRFEIGYWVRQSAQRQGYATEIANALTRYAFEQLEARAVCIGHAAGNDNSRGVIEKLGFTLEGVFKNETALPDGTVVDSYIYSRMDMNGLPPLDVKWRR